MSLVSNISNGFKRSFRFKNVAGYTMLIQFGLSMLVGLMTIKYVNSSIGSSTNLMKIIEGYNHDVFQDLLRFESTGWSMIKTLICLTLGIYLLIGPFISGGLLSAYHKGLDQWNIFWSGGSKFYFSFLKMNLLIFLILGLSTLILGGFAFMFSTYGLENFLSEVPVLMGIGLVLLLIVLIAIYLISISTKAKWIMIQSEDKTVWSNFKLGIKSIKKRKTYYLVLGIVFLMLSILFAFLNNGLINYIPESGFLLMLLAFFLQLWVLFFRVFLRNAYLGSLVEE